MRIACILTLSLILGIGFSLPLQAHDNTVIAENNPKIDSLDPANREYLERYCRYHPTSGLCYFTPNPPAKPKPVTPPVVSQPPSELPVGTPPQTPWVPSATTCGGAVPSNAVRPGGSGKVDGRFPNNSVVDLRGRGLNVTIAERSGVVIRGESNVRVTGAKIVGPAPHDTPWNYMKKHPRINNGYDGDGILFKGPNGVATVDNAWIDNMMDALSFPTVRAFQVCGVYARYIRDDFIEDDGCKDGVIRDTLVDNTHMFISVRPGHQSRGKKCSPNLTIEDSLVSIGCQPYNGDMKGHKDSRSCNGRTTGAGQIFKTSVGGPIMNVKNSIFLVESINEGGTPQMSMPRGTYSNVTIVWLGSGPYPGGLQPGVKVTNNIGVWNQARDAWLARHGCDAKGNTCTFTQH